MEFRRGLFRSGARGGVSVFASVARPSRRQWQNYVDGLSLPTRYPDLVGLGFATYATPAQLGAMQRMMREAGEGLYRVHPPGVREHYGPILYLEPRTPQNIGAIDRTSTRLNTSH